MAKPKPFVAAKLAGGDAVATGLWVLVSSLFAEVATYMASISGQNESLMGISVLILALAAFAPLCNALGGAIFNPLNSVALIASGHGVLTNVVRMVGQLVGAIAGTMLAIKLIPQDLQGKFHSLSGGVKAGVAFEVGFACEGTLSFILNYIFLMSIGSKSKLMTVWIPLLSAIVLTYVGFHFTGPSLNPFISFSWHFLHNQKQTAAEHALVFWAAPILGAASAGILHTLLKGPGKSRRRGRTPAGVSKKRQ